MRPWHLLPFRLGKLHGLPKWHLQLKQWPGELHGLPCGNLQSKPELDISCSMPAVPRWILQQSNWRELVFCLRSLSSRNVLAKRFTTAVHQLSKRNIQHECRFHTTNELHQLPSRHLQS